MGFSNIDNFDFGSIPSRHTEDGSYDERNSSLGWLEARCREGRLVLSSLTAHVEDAEINLLLKRHIDLLQSMAAWCRGEQPPRHPLKLPPGALNHDHPGHGLLPRHAHELHPRVTRAALQMCALVDELVAQAMRDIRGLSPESDRWFELGHLYDRLGRLRRELAQRIDSIERTASYPTENGVLGSE